MGMRLQNFSSQLHEKIIQANAATKKIEQQKIQLQENLDQLAKTRLQLVHAEKMASIGQLGAGVAHEINNPIGFINGNLESLDEYKNNVTCVLQSYKPLETHIANGADDELKKMLENIEQIKEEQDLEFVLTDMGELITESLDGASRIQKIVKDLKSFSRVDDQGFQDVDLNKDVIETALRLVWSEMKDKCTLDKSLSSLPQYSCHPGELSQVILNLLVNASDAIEKDGIIGVHSEFIDNAIQIKISDNGTGINEQDLLKLFDPFFSTKDIGKGTGLGLSTAQGIVDKHGGSLTVESKLGLGTTFIIKLPLTDQVEMSLGDSSENTAKTAYLIL